MIQQPRKGKQVRAFILEQVTSYPRDIAKLVAEKFQLTRQAVNKHLQQLIQEKKLTFTGRTRNKLYKLSILDKKSYFYEITTNLAEDLVWRKDILQHLRELPSNIFEIWHYGFTEMFNNALDHANASKIWVNIEKTAVNTAISISDNGIGIFKKIQASFDLLDERQAILELAKGKLTTDPNRHSGEGIFFTSKMFDSYTILSREVCFAHQFKPAKEWILTGEKPAQGTIVFMLLSNTATRTTTQIYNQFATDDDYSFNKTIISVKLAQYEKELLVSRSQAKKLLSRLELFKTVIFDFTDIDAIGQAFADEIFRVFACQHPSIELVPLQANKQVSQMINRAKSNRSKVEND